MMLYYPEFESKANDFILHICSDHVCYHRGNDYVAFLIEYVIYKLWNEFDTMSLWLF